MTLKKLFDPNVYSESAMPFVTAVCKFLNADVLSAVPLEESEIDAREHFNRGFRFGMMLMLDVLGEKALIN